MIAASPSPADTLTVYFGLLLLLLCIPALVAASNWALRREADRTAAATFDRDYIAENADVLEQDTPAIIEEILALLEDSNEHIKRLQKAAAA